MTGDDFPKRRGLLKTPATMALAALFLAACSRDKPLSLPTDPIDRAATCGIVAAAAARVAMTEIKKPLPLAAQGRILHYATLAASEGESFDAQVASQVSQRMPQLQADLTRRKWQSLAAPCASAYPAAEKVEISLPASRAEALLQCDEAASFLLLALESQNSDYANALGEYRKLKRKLDAAIVPILRARAGTSPAAQQAERRKAMAKATALGSPVPLLDACTKKFG
jgi:hypothetical protein